MTEPQKKPREIRMSRRLFFALAIGGGSAACVAAMAAPPIREQLFEKLDSQTLEERIIAEATDNRRSWILTAVETVCAFGAVVGVGSLIDRLTGIKHGGRAGDGELYAEQAEEAPLATYVRDIWLIPIIEEAFFRLIPSSLFAEEKPPNIRMHWGTGLTSAAVFAGIHNFSKPEPQVIVMHLDSLPVEQFAMGAYWWYAQRTGGYLHAAGSHVLYNNLCEASWYFVESKKQVATGESDSRVDSESAADDP
ncbi:MAG: lysostaphin resistance A-like protein [Pirellulaceae bacterium]|nr:lysostaphin resistance A-like protein [Pirellulaceae bacterium]